MTRSRTALAACLTICGGAAASATQPPLYPAPVRTMSFDGGYALRFGQGAGNERYYRFTYHGKMVREAGTPFSQARGLDLLAPRPTEASGDVSALTLRFEDGAASVGGGLLEALGTKELAFPGITTLGLRGTSRLAADEQFEHLVATVGLETRPVRVPGLGKRGVSNWIVLGLNAERREATDSTAPDANVALATWRTFVGAAVGYRKRASPGRVADKVARDILTAAPTLGQAKALADSLEKIAAKDRTHLQQLVVDAANEASSDTAWQETVRALAAGTADAITDQPTAAVYAEWTGWVDLASDPTGGRVRSLVTATLDYWPIPSRDDLLLKLRYEVGYERALPGERRDQLLIAVGIRF